MRIKMYVEEVSKLNVLRDDIEIDTKFIPEIDGKNEEEIVEFINKNMWNMKPTDKSYKSLGEQLTSQHVIYQSNIPENFTVVIS
jgi:hypothetical protein